jgi:hypothetical protein
MAMPVKEIAKQKIDMLSQDDIMELLGFLNALEQRHECAKEENQGELRHALEELRETCGADNWDGYGACALHKESIRRLCVCFNTCRQCFRSLMSRPTLMGQSHLNGAMVRVRSCLSVSAIMANWCMLESSTRVARMEPNTLNMLSPGSLWSIFSEYSNK